MGPAKWAVLWQWACSSLSAEDVRPEMEQSLTDLKQLDKTLSNNMQSIEGKTSAQLQACFDHTRFGHILGRDHWYRDILQQRSDLSNAVRDFSGEIAQVRSRIEKQVQVLNQEINARLMLERQERDRQMAAEEEARAHEKRREERAGKERFFGCLGMMLLAFIWIIWFTD